MFSIFVDADSLPKNIRLIILRASYRLSCNVIFVADRPLADILHHVNLSKEKIKMVVVQSAENSADDKIFEMAQCGDLCITHDIPLAARLLEKNCIVIDDRGLTYSKDNIKMLLVGREVNNTLREAGVFSQQQTQHSAKLTQSFANNFDRVLTKAFKNSVESV